MSISTLSKITVPLDSSQSASNQGLLMPKLQYRFRVSLENFGVSTPTTELTKQVVDITRPNLSFETTTIDVYNSKVYLAGKHTWETVTLTLREDVSNLSLIHISEPTRLGMISYAVFCLKKKTNNCLALVAPRWPSQKHS